MESLRSISAESGEWVEVIMVDDGSDDGSAGVAGAMKQELSDLRITLLTRRNAGTAAARNAGLMRARGEWVFFLDADDDLAFDPIPYIRKYSFATGIVFPLVMMRHGRIYKKRKPVAIPPGRHLDVFSAGNPNMVSAYLVRRDCISRMFEEDFLYMEDWLFWISNPRVFERSIVCRDTASSVIHLHGGNKSSDFLLNGTFRERVAEKVLNDAVGMLSRRQRNNLRINLGIGRIQQGRKVPAGILLCWPSDPVLYIKLLAYFIMKKRLERLDPYRS